MVHLGVTVHQVSISPGSVTGNIILRQLALKIDDIVMCDCRNRRDVLVVIGGVAMFMFGGKNNTPQDIPIHHV